MAEQIRTACQELGEQGQQVTPAAVVRHLGMGVTVTALARHPELRAAVREEAAVRAQERRDLQGEARTRRQEKEREQVAQALEHLSKVPDPITFKTVAHAAGFERGYLEEIPEFRERIRAAQIAHSNWRGNLLSPSEREERLLRRVQEVVELHKAQGEPLTKTALARAVPCGRPSLRSSLRIRAYLATALPRHRTPPLSNRDRVLVARLEQTLDELRAEGKPLNRAILSRRSGVSYHALFTNPYLVEVLISRIPSRMKVSMGKRGWRGTTSAVSST
jgi:hypothetical protein